MQVRNADSSVSSTIRNATMGELSETVKKRRSSWPWVVLAGILVLVGARIAWRFRPLSPDELAVAGVWMAGRDPGGIFRDELTLSPSRSFLRRHLHNEGSVTKETGSWHIDGQRLVLTYHIPTRTYLALCLRNGVLPEPVQARYELLDDPPTLRGNVLWERASD
jgi:hypothetical protein